MGDHTVQARARISGESGDARASIHSTDLGRRCAGAEQIVRELTKLGYLRLFTLLARL